MKQILDHMQSEAMTEKDLPFFLCGDFNTEWNSKEPAELIITQNFFNANNLYTREKSFENRTCCDYRDYWWKAGRSLENFKTKAEIIDYALILKDPASQCCQLKN